MKKKPSEQIYEAIQFDMNEDRRMTLEVVIPILNDFDERISKVEEILARVEAKAFSPKPDCYRYTCDRCGAEEFFEHSLENTSCSRCGGRTTRTAIMRGEVKT